MEDINLYDESMPVYDRREDILEEDEDEEETVDESYLNYVSEDANYSEENCYPVFIILQHSGTAMANIIQKFTKDEYSHAAISFNSALDPMYTFGNKNATTLKGDAGFVIQNPKSEFYSNYNVKYAIYVMYVTQQQYMAMQKALNTFIVKKDEWKFGFFELISIWLNKPSEKSKKYFCSRFVAEIINAGYKMDKFPSLYKPQDLKYLNNISLVNKGNNFRHYNSMITDANLEYIKSHDFKSISVHESNEEYSYETLPTKPEEVVFDLPEVPVGSDIRTILDNTDPKHIYFTSDWHISKNHYKHEANYVNTAKIAKWCRDNIKDNDVFFYLGDIAFRYANEEDQKKSQEIMSKIPGIKVFILGNHDKMLGQEYFTACGFDYVFEELEWKNYIFTHEPINMDTKPSNMINIHGHIHNMETYNTTDGKRNVNVYPMWFDNKPITLDYIINHVDELTKNHSWNWNVGYSEANLIFNTDNIKYNCDTLAPNTSNNILFITGYSGAGKSTLMANLNEKYGNNIMTVAGDVFFFVCRHKYRVDNGIAVNDNQIAQYGFTNVTSRNFMGPVLARYFDFYYDEIKLSNDLFSNKELFRYWVHFVKWLYKDTAVNKVFYRNKIVVVEGIQISNTDPELYKDHALIIVGTSALVSWYRKAKRDIIIPSKYDWKHIKTLFTMIPVYANDYKRLNNLEKLNESKRSELLGFSNRYTKININSDNILKYKNKCSSLKHIKDDAKGYIYLDSDDNVAALIAINDKDGNKWITALEIFGSAKGNGLSYKLLDVAVKEFKATHLSVRKTNSIAKHVYDKYGFVVYDSTDTMYFMKLGSNVNESKRSELPDSSFGIPEDRKYPLDTEQHVRSAIKLFGHAEESKKKSLARRIRAAAKKYDISIPETTQCYKYLNESMVDIIPSNITNVIFDLGSVLVDYNYAASLKMNPDIPNEFVSDIKDAIYTHLFFPVDGEDERYIQMLDIDQAIERFERLAPEHIKPYAKEAIESFRFNTVFNYDYTDQLIEKCKQQGYNIYYLSNWGKYTYTLQKSYFDRLLPKFNGGIMSFQVDMLKPDPEIYLALCNKYNLDPASCMFFDDKVVNVEGAKRVGMQAYVFDHKTTPHKLLNEGIDIPENADDYLLIQTSRGLRNLPIDKINQWYASDSRETPSINIDQYSTTANDAIHQAISKLIDAKAFDKNIYIPLYVFANSLFFTGNGSNNAPICIGQVNAFPTNDFEWVIQYPLKINGEAIESVKEYSMANTNPVIGIGRSFMINTGEKLAYAQDIEPEKCLVVNDDGVLEVQSTDDMQISEVYEFIGNKAYVNRLSKLYKESAKVDNIYSILTSKPLLSNDQIAFDESFRKIDFDLLEQKAISEFATLKDQIIAACGMKGFNGFVVESAIRNIDPPFMSKYNVLGDISIKEDFDGVYFYSELTHKRSASVKSPSMLTENMLIAIL